MEESDARVGEGHTKWHGRAELSPVSRLLHTPGLNDFLYDCLTKLVHWKRQSTNDVSSKVTRDYIMVAVVKVSTNVQSNVKKYYDVRRLISVLVSVHKSVCLPLM